MPVVTGIVYQSPNVEFQLSETDSYSVRAKVDIRAGTLVLLEHVVYGKRKDMHGALMLDEGLRTSLYPRDADSSNEIKINFNVFSFNGDLVIGDKITKFNHACRPNCFLTTADRVNDDYIYGAWTIKSVKAGDELTFDYTNGTADIHSETKAMHGFECGCTETDLKRAEKRAEIEFALVNTFRDAMVENGSTASLVDSYMMKGGIKVTQQQKNARKLAKQIKFLNKNI